ncbi:FxsC protein [Paraburkholderia sp. SIMBA_054]|uniref:FxsC protein n=1 Tax=Paraburkholderia sp. SIMBA_054 TaxID=3085795 RepID=UPI003979CA95
MSRPIFISYASDNRRFQSDRELFDSFLEKLENEIEQIMGPRQDKVAFVAHRDIETGDEWPADLGDALRTARVMLYFGSAHYYNSQWCGREFEVFQTRRRAWITAHPGEPTPLTIVPVKWIPTDEPEVASRYQDSNAAFPPDYRELGLRKLLDLERKAEWKQVLTALAKRLTEALNSPIHLPDLQHLEPMHQIASAFHSVPAATGAHAALVAPAASAIRGNIACFVFVAGTQAEIVKVDRRDTTAWGVTDGWDWRPYHPQSPESVGALAQRAAGDRNLRFVQLDCGKQLIDKLREAKGARIPVVIFADPWSAQLEPYRELLKEYDEVNLLNCAVLVPWNRDDPETLDNEKTLLSNLEKACNQKMLLRYPGHHWKIGSSDEFRARASMILDEITHSLLANTERADIRRAESPALAAAAKEQGIRPDVQPHLVATPPDAGAPSCPA